MVSQRRVFDALQRLAETHSGTLLPLDQPTPVRFSGNRSLAVDKTEIEFDPEGMCFYCDSPLLFRRPGGVLDGCVLVGSGVAAVLTSLRRVYYSKKLSEQGGVIPDLVWSAVKPTPLSNCQLWLPLLSLLCYAVNFWPQPGLWCLL